MTNFSRARMRELLTSAEGATHSAYNLWLYMRTHTPEMLDLLDECEKALPRISLNGQSLSSPLKRKLEKTK